MKNKQEENHPIRKDDKMFKRFKPIILSKTYQLQNQEEFDKLKDDFL